MSFKLIIRTLFAGLFIFNSGLLKSQTIIKGTVYDSVNQKPIPFANVVFLHSTVGTITDNNGVYYIETNKPSEDIVATFLGYQNKVVTINKGEVNIIDFYLDPVSVSIEEVIITPGENPAFRILDAIKSKRKYHNTRKFSSYQYNSYNKMRLDFTNVDEKFMDSRLMRQFQFVFEHIDTSEIFGKNYLPMLISESVTNYYYQKTPAIEKEVIEAFKISGIENNTISQYSGKMYQKLNIYDNFITLFEPGFISPIADFGRLYYKYLLEDSTYINGSWCYKVVFKPKRTKERTFFGYFWVADSSWAIKKIQLRVSSDVNINFMNDMVAILEYEQINDSIWFLSKEDLFMDFIAFDKMYGFFGRKQSAYKDIKINEPIPEEILKHKTNTYVDHEIIEKEDNYWEENRLIELQDKEKEIYELVDSIKQVPMFKTVYGLAMMFMEYYYTAGPVEIGPYYTFYSNNIIEGHRFRIGGRSGVKFSKKIRIGGHVAYGTLDERFKHGLVTEFMFNTNPRRKLEFSHFNDMRQLGKSQNAYLDDNILATLTRRRPNYKLTLVNQLNLKYQHEWFQGMSNTISLMHQSIYSTEYIPFVLNNNDGSTDSLNTFTNSELSLGIHFAYEEKFLVGKFERISLGSKYPIIDLNITYSPDNILENSFEYIKIKAQIRDKIETNPIGYLRYWVRAEKIFGDVPYPLLKLHEGNETYAYDIYAFNMMNYYEFASDAYVTISAEQHLQGFFLNKIPILRKLAWREVISAKFLAGELNSSSRDIMQFPDGLNELTKPYLEAGAGLENIFKLFRIEATWRLAYLDNPDIQRFGLRANIQFTF